MKVSWWKALGIIGLVADELTKAGRDDDKISVDESLAIMARIAPAVGLQFDNAGEAFTVDLLSGILDAANDGKITIRELVSFAERICMKYGIEFDKQGVEL
jgi:hypothetical protein